MIELHGTGNLDRNQVGGKAFYLDRLISLGFRTPETLVILPDEDINTESLQSWVDSLGQDGSSRRLAIRSSAANEDSKSESKAGHFLSLVGDFSLEAIAPAVRQVRASGPDMAVLVQPLLRATFAGVLFSCHPLTFNKTEMTVVWTRGLANRLVAGDEAGQQAHTTRNGKLVDGNWPVSPNLLEQLTHHASVVEEALQGPVDIEWVIDQDQVLWLVQARHIVLPKAARVWLSTKDAFSALPSIVQAHSKIRLRRQAITHNVPMAPAIVECCSETQVEPQLQSSLFEKSAGVSVVLLHPERVDQQVVREFAPVLGSDVNFFARTCRRYAIRRYPRTTNVDSARVAVLQAGMAISWVSVAIVQAVWDAYATGIIQRSPNGYLIEVALGHFVPKGVVPTSTIILSPEKQIVSTLWRDQPTSYRFVDGHVITETPPKNHLKLSPSVLTDIASTLDPLFNVYDAPVLEFGILRGPLGHRVYLIDVAEGNDTAATLDTALVNSGVLSLGRCRGRAWRVNLSAIGALDTHFYDRPTEASVAGEGVVIVAERASVDLLPFASTPGVVGFVFERGSVLAHLAVVLREKGIPAVALEDQFLALHLVTGSLIEIDATSHSLPHSKRVKVVEDANAVDHPALHKS